MEITMKSVNGEQLQGRVWGDAQTARAVVVLVHG